MKLPYFPKSCLIPLLFSRCTDQPHTALDPSLLRSLAVCVPEEGPWPVEGDGWALLLLCQRSDPGSLLRQDSTKWIELLNFSH